MGGSPRQFLDYWRTPERIRANAVHNDEALRVARNTWGAIALRFPIQVRKTRNQRKGAFVALRGEAFTIKVDEAIDVWDLLKDLKAFVAAWRPMRRRTEEAKETARRLQEEWGKLANQVR